MAVGISCSQYSNICKNNFPCASSRSSAVMKSLQKLRIFLSPSKPPSLLFSPTFSSSPSSSSSSSSSSSTDTKTALTQEELTQVNLLIPRLCSSNHLQEAINLINTALLTTPSPPLKSLSLSILIHRLSSESDLTHSMFFLNRLKYNPKAHPSLLAITKALISTYFRIGKPREAMKVFNWVLRPDSPCEPDSKFYGVLVNGFCRNAMILEALKTVRVMMGANLVPGTEVRTRVCRGLLREARIKEALKLNEALDCVGSGGGGESAQKVLELLDHMIGNWVE